MYLISYYCCRLYSIGRWMQSAVVRVWPKTGHVLETFRVPDTEGALQDKSVEMVPEHVVLKDDYGMYIMLSNISYIYVCVYMQYIYITVLAHSYTSVAHRVRCPPCPDFLYKRKPGEWRRFHVNKFCVKYVFIFLSILNVGNTVCPLAFGLPLVKGHVYVVARIFH